MRVRATHTVTGGDGVRLHLTERGNPNGRPILFIHGFSQAGLCWTKQLESDLAGDFRLVAMDLRGHGRSDKPRDAYGDSRSWADDVRATIDELGLDGAVLSGWSYGGYVICDYLRVHGEGRLGGVHLVGAATKIGTKEARARFGQDFLALVPGFLSEVAEESVGALATFVRLCVRDEPPPADLYFFLGYNVTVPPHVRRGLFSRKVDNDDVLARITRPVLITHGQEDAIVLPLAAADHAAAIPHARTSFYRDIGHAPFWEDAPRFNRELREFAASLA